MHAPLTSVYQTSTAESSRSPAVLGGSPAAEVLARHVTPTAYQASQPSATRGSGGGLGSGRSASASRKPEQPRAPAPRLTLGALRKHAEESKSARIPLIDRIKEPEVPARFKQKKKTVAFGVTTNVSQTVERTKDTTSTSSPMDQLPYRRTTLTTSAAPMRSGLVGAGGHTGTTTPTLAGRATTAAPTPATPSNDENKDPNATAAAAAPAATLESAMETIGRLTARVEELEKREREAAQREDQQRREFERIIEIIARHMKRDVEEAIDRRRGVRRGGGGSGEDDDDGEEEEDRDGERSDRDAATDRKFQSGVRAPRRVSPAPLRRSEPHQQRVHSNKTRKDERGGGGGRAYKGGDEVSPRLLEPSTLSALERQLAHNPVLRRAVQDAIDQDRYDHEYGGGTAVGSAPRRRRSPSPLHSVVVRDISPRPFPPRRHQPSNDVYHRTRGGGSAGRGYAAGRHASPARVSMSTRRRADGTPSRRRMTERVMVERVHHFDDDDDDDDVIGGGYGSGEVDDEEEEQLFETRLGAGGYTQAYSNDIVQEFAESDFRPLRRRQDAHRPAAAGAAGPRIQEINEEDADESRLEQKKRELRERRLARQRGER